MKMFRTALSFTNGIVQTKDFEKYEDAINHYNIIKEEKEYATIELLKVENDVETRIFIKKNSKTKIKKSLNILNELKSLHKEVLELQLYHEHIIITAERKRELNLHLLTDSSMLNLDAKCKNKRKEDIINDLEYWENLRRDSKNELKMLNVLKENFEEIDFNEIEDVSENQSIKVNVNHYEKTVSFNSKEELDLLIQNNIDYAYYSVNQIQNIIYFYNRFDAGKSLNHFKKNKEQKLKVSSAPIKEEIVKFKYKSFKQRMSLVKKHQDKYLYMYDCSIRKCLYFSNTIKLDVNTAK